MGRIDRNKFMNSLVDLLIGYSNVLTMKNITKSVNRFTIVSFKKSYDFMIRVNCIETIEFHHKLLRNKIFARDKYLSCNDDSVICNNSWASLRNNSSLKKGNIDCLINESKKSLVECLSHRESFISYSFIKGFDVLSKINIDCIRLMLATSNLKKKLFGLVDLLKNELIDNISSHNVRRVAA